MVALSTINLTAYLELTIDLTNDQTLLTPPTDQKCDSQNIDLTRDHLTIDQELDHMIRDHILSHRL